MALETTNVTTGQVRLSFVHLFKPYAAKQGQEPRYSTTILLPKSDIATKQRIDAAIQAAAQKGVSSVWNGARPPQLKTPIWDGDGVRQNGEHFGPECKGHWVFTASSKQPQQIVDANMNPIIDQTQIYSGVYGRVNVNFFPFSNSGNRGVGCGLGPVQKLADGESLSGQISADQAFGNPENFASLSASAPGNQPGYGQVPAGYIAPVMQPGFNTQTPPGYAAPQPQYGQSAAPAYSQQPMQPQYPQQQTQQPKIDPITGQPLAGGIYGL